MPINYNDYPNNWNEIRRDILLRAGGDPADPAVGSSCEWCGVRNYSMGYRLPDGTFSCVEEADSYRASRDAAVTFARNPRNARKHPITIVLTIAHITDPDPMNVDPDNLAALCQRCHNRHDAKQRGRNRRKTKLDKWAKRVGQKQIEVVL